MMISKCQEFKNSIFLMYIYLRFNVSLKTSRIMSVCRECGSFQLVYCWADGDLVCRDCGLVAQEHVIDERPERVCDYTYYDNNVECKDIEDVKVGLTVKQICENKGIKEKTFWKKTKTKEHKSCTTELILKRMTYECPYITKSMEWDIIKQATSFLHIMEKQNVTHTLKPDKLSISLIIIVGELLKIKGFTREKLCAHYKISSATLKKNELLLQQCCECCEALK